MKRKRLIIVSVSVLVILVIAGMAAVIIIRGRLHTETATGYEDKSGWVYSCSRPVEVKNQGATYGNGTPSPTPVNPAEAAKYCHRIGIE